MSRSKFRCLPLALALVICGDVCAPARTQTARNATPANDNWTIGWFTTATIWEAATATVSPLQPGNHRVTWRDAIAGRPLQTTMVRADPSGLTWQIPRVSSDVAVWAERR